MSYPDKHETISQEEWMARLENNHIQRYDMNKLIMNYLVTEGFKEAAEKFQQESGISPNIDLNTLDDRIRIRDAVQNGRIQEAMTLVNEMNPELLDNDRYLLFHLQQLQLIELIREGRIENALHYAQWQLSETGQSQPDILPELERTLALLAFNQPEQSPFGDLLSPAHRQKIASELNAAILKAQNQDVTAPKLSTLLKLILWAQDKLDEKKIKYPKMSDLDATQSFHENKNN